MAQKKHITAKVSYHDLEGGFWGLTDTQGNDYRPINMPNQLKTQGVTVKCTVKLLEDVVSIHMWGTPVEVVSFETTLG